MTAPPLLIEFGGDWPPYENIIYDAFLETFVRSGLRFLGLPVRAQFRPETRGKGFSFWHVISEALAQDNREEDDRIPDMRRCERIRWIAWAISCAEAKEAGFSWWENSRGRNTHIVIWAEEFDFAVILARRKDYLLLKTAYAEIRSNRRRAFERERDAFLVRHKD